MPTITKNQLVDRLMNLRGAKFTTIVAETDPRMLKTGNPFVGATKISRVNGCGQLDLPELGKQSAGS